MLKQTDSIGTLNILYTAVSILHMILQRGLEFLRLLPWYRVICILEFLVPRGRKAQLKHQLTSVRTRTPLEVPNAVVEHCIRGWQVADCYVYSCSSVVC